MACFPVLLLAGRPAVARLTAAALLGFVREGHSAGGALREDHDVCKALLEAPNRLADPWGLHYFCLLAACKDTSKREPKRHAVV